MEIRKITSCKKDYLPLLLLGDEQEDMIDRYLERGTLYALFIEDAARAVCVVTDEGNGVLEIKNIAVEPAFQKKGLGRALIAYIENAYRQTHAVLQVGTGESPLTVPFYEKCGLKPQKFGMETIGVHVSNQIIDQADLQEISKLFVSPTRVHGEIEMLNKQNNVSFYNMLSDSDFYEFFTMLYNELFIYENGVVDV